MITNHLLFYYSSIYYKQIKKNDTYFLNITLTNQNSFHKRYLFVIRTMNNGASKPINPIVKEAFFFIGCLYHLRKRFNLQGFKPDFNKKMFGPYICNKLSRWDGDIRDAVALWHSNPVAAEERYGHISQWDTSRVTNMSYLFHYDEFNEDISKWDVSKVENMDYMFYYASSFNQPIGNWNVSNVEFMKGMFDGC
jgi:surface protein